MNAFNKAVPHRKHGNLLYLIDLPAAARSSQLECIARAEESANRLLTAKATCDRKVRLRATTSLVFEFLLSLSTGLPLRSAAELLPQDREQDTPYLGV